MKEFRKNCLSDLAGCQAIHRLALSLHDNAPVCDFDVTKRSVERRSIRQGLLSLFPRDFRAEEKTGRNSSGQHCATFWRIECAMAVMPRMRTMPNESAKPKRLTRLGSKASTSSGLASAKISTKRLTNPLTVGASGATSACTCTRPSSIVAHKNTGVWHSCTRPAPASRWAAHSGGKGASFSANSSKSSNRSRGSNPRIRPTTRRPCRSASSSRRAPCHLFTG